ncbi:DUF3486 family protein [Oligella urethralis]|uniref:Phage terminase, small subunit n=1 Tax=Oligella urethralis DNF00040 TaxID=1401065 RepID=A0A095Z743_9BURK|nr:DUF3486 family protein [Oligella urethralis]KGF30483.1 hypothetical protein HMPREF2130_06600 [Oligella urethralis DNF00040]SUA58072.1 Protein of uncharacterised function (DUF3486) [Oligella urethralis]
MAKRNRVSELPAEVKAWLDKALVDGNFSGYQLLEDALRDKGYAISKSAIHRYGQKVERRMAAIKASTEAARLITESASDEKDDRSEAVIAMIQTELFDSILNLQDASDVDIKPQDRVKLLSAAAKNIATLTHASVKLKQYQQEVKERVQAAASSVEKIAKKGGLSAESVEQLRREILGITR